MSNKSKQLIPVVGLPVAIQSRNVLFDTFDVPMLNRHSLRFDEHRLEQLGRQWCYGCIQFDDVVAVLLCAFSV